MLPLLPPEDGDVAKVSGNGFSIKDSSDPILLCFGGGLLPPLPPEDGDVATVSGKGFSIKDSSDPFLLCFGGSKPPPYGKKIYFLTYRLKKAVPPGFGCRCGTAS